MAQSSFQLDKPKFYLGLAIALILHIVLISLPLAFWTDINLFKAWSLALVQQSFANFYAYTNCDYPPAYLYVLWLTGKIYQLFDPLLSHSNEILLMEILKFPSTLADIGSAWLIAQILKPHTSDERAYQVALIYAFNPLVIFVSAIWGQVDGVMIFLMLGTFYLLQQDYLVRAGLLTAFMVIVKPQGLFLAPFLLLSQWFRQPWWKWLAIALSGLTLIWFIVLPFYGLDHGVITPFISLYRRLQSTANYYDYASVNAFNIWGWANWQKDYTQFLGVSYKLIGLALLGILLVYLGIFLYQQRSFAAQAIAVATLLVGCFMLPTRMHERYMLYELAFLAIALALFPIVKWLYYGFTLTGGLNVGYAYIRYNYGDLFNAFPETFWNGLIYSVSVLNIILFLVLLTHLSRSQPLSQKQSAL